LLLEVLCSRVTELFCVFDPTEDSVKREKEKMEMLQLEKQKSQIIFIYTFFKVILSFSLSTRAGSLED